MGRWDCISINDKPVEEKVFRLIEKNVTNQSLEEGINASPFEILVATAFHIFNQSKVEIGVVEVGMGGKLDATNVLNNQAVSVIGKIARDHEGFLGNTLEEITQHKAGILRPGVPYLVNPSNEWNVQTVIDEHAKEIGAGPRRSADSRVFPELWRIEQWRRLIGPLQRSQRDNALLAVVAVQEAVKSLANRKSEADFSLEAMAKMYWKGMSKTNPGRFQYTTVQSVFGEDGTRGRRLLVDGAHNTDAAEALHEFVLKRERRRRIATKAPSDGWPVTWVLAMTEGKDARGYLSRILKSGDNVITTSFGAVDGMPWVKSMDPKELLDIARLVQPDITGLHIPEAGPLRALCTARYLANEDHPIVLTGSLYLVGDFHRELRVRSNPDWWQAPEFVSDRDMFTKIHRQEKERVYRFLSAKDATAVEVETDVVLTEEEQRQRKAREKLRKLQEEIQRMNEKIARLDREYSGAFTPPAKPDSSASSPVSIATAPQKSRRIQKQKWKAKGVLNIRRVFVQNISSEEERPRVVREVSSNSYATPASRKAKARVKARANARGNERPRDDGV